MTDETKGERAPVRKKAPRAAASASRPGRKAAAGKTRAPQPPAPGRVSDPHPRDPYSSGRRVWPD